MTNLFTKIFNPRFEETLEQSEARMHKLRRERPDYGAPGQREGSLDDDLPDKVERKPLLRGRLVPLLQDMHALVNLEAE